MRKFDFQNDVLPLKDKLFRLALRITLSREEAEDIVQETMIKVWNKRESWNEIESMEAFCMTICRNMAIDKTRKVNNDTESIDDKTVSQETDGISPEEKTIISDRVSIVRTLINELPEKQKTAMQLRDFEGKSYKEIADIMNVSEDQVKISIFRARQAIKKRFLDTENYGL